MDLFFKTCNVLFLSAIAILVFTQSAEGIKCWVCRSDLDPGCADPFDNSTFHFTDCDRQTLPNIRGAPTMCRKIRQKVNGHWRYVRSCAWLSDTAKMQRRGDERYCLIRSGTWDIHIEYCECYSKDGCNGSGTIAFSWKLLGVAVAAVVLSPIWNYFL